MCVMYICDFGVEASLRACCRASLIPVCIVASLLTLWVTQLLIHETKLDSGIHNTPGVLVSCLCLERKAAGQTLVSLWGNVVIHIHMWWRARWLHRGLARGSCGRVLKPGFGAESVWMCVCSSVGIGLDCSPDLSRALWQLLSAEGGKEEVRMDRWILADSWDAAARATNPHKQDSHTL